jgi:hypothetical protein
MSFSDFVAHHKIAKTLAVLLLLGTVTQEIAADTTWTLSTEEEGMRVFIGDVSGSPFSAVKVIASINAPVDNVVSVLGDGSDCAKWRGMCKSSQVLKIVSEQERFVHMVLDLPWPISDRDAVVRSVTEIDTEVRTVTINVTPASDELPEQDYVRATTNAQFLLRVVSENEVELTYTVHADLGGDLSPGIINSRLASATVEDVERLVALAES